MEKKEGKKLIRKDLSEILPGPGYYNPKYVSRNLGMRLGRFKTIDSKKVHLSSPGPGAYTFEKKSE